MNVGISIWESGYYFLLRLWVLNKYHNHQNIHEITEDTISMSINLFC